MVIENNDNHGVEEENKECKMVDNGKKISSRQKGKSPDNVTQGTSISSKVRRKRRKEILREKKKLKRKGKKYHQIVHANHKVHANHNFVLTENEVDRKVWVLLQGDAKEVSKDGKRLQIIAQRGGR